MAPARRGVEGASLEFLMASRGNDHFAYSAPVGSFRAGASPCAALDMAGNVAEWCAGALSGGEPGAPAGANQPLRVIRGGSWNDDMDALPTASRRGFPEADRNRAVGFRGVMAVPARR